MGEGNGTPLQYSCLENPMDGGAWWVTVHGVAKSRTRPSDLTFTFDFHALEKEMATHSSVLAWRIPGMGEPGGLPSMGSHRVGHDWSDLAARELREKLSRVKIFSSSFMKMCCLSLEWGHSHLNTVPNFWMCPSQNYCWHAQLSKKVLMNFLDLRGDVLPDFAFAMLDTQ